MNKNLQTVVENVVDGIIKGAYDYKNFDRNLDYELMHFMGKYNQDADGKMIVTQEFTATLKQLRGEVNNNWKFKKHNANIDTIRKLHLGTKEYYEFYNGFYDKE